MNPCSARGLVGVLTLLITSKVRGFVHPLSPRLGNALLRNSCSSALHVDPVRTERRRIRGTLTRYMTANEEEETKVPVLKRTRKRRKQEPVSQAIDYSVPDSSLVDVVEDEDRVGTSSTTTDPMSIPDSPPPVTKGRKVVVDGGDDEIGVQFSDVAAAAAGVVGTVASAAGSAAKSVTSAVMSQDDEDDEDEIRKKPSMVDMSELGADIAKFRTRESISRQSRGKDESLASGASALFSNILSVDFFVVVAFMVWFFAGVVSTYGFNNTFLLDEFNELWTPVVQPALGLLMAGTIAGGVLSKFSGSDDED
ncbi:unnamed protein product [Choristocarpus tenellus]